MVSEKRYSQRELSRGGGLVIRPFKPLGGSSPLSFDDDSGQQKRLGDFTRPAFVGLFLIVSGLFDQLVTLSLHAAVASPRVWNSCTGLSARVRYEIHGRRTCILDGFPSHQGR